MGTALLCVLLSMFIWYGRVICYPTDSYAAERAFQNGFAGSIKHRYDLTYGKAADSPPHQSSRPSIMKFPSQFYNTRYEITAGAGADENGLKSSSNMLFHHPKPVELYNTASGGANYPNLDNNYPGFLQNTPYTQSKQQQLVDVPIDRHRMFPGSNTLGMYNPGTIQDGTRGTMHNKGDLILDGSNAYSDTNDENSGFVSTNYESVYKDYLDKFEKRNPQTFNDIPVNQRSILDRGVYAKDPEVGPYNSGFESSTILPPVNYGLSATNEGHRKENTYTDLKPIRFSTSNHRDENYDQSPYDQVVPHHRDGSASANNYGHHVTNVFVDDPNKRMTENVGYPEIHQSHGMPDPHAASTQDSYAVPEKLEGHVDMKEDSVVAFEKNIGAKLGGEIYYGPQGPPKSKLTCYLQDDGCAVFNGNAFNVLNSVGRFADIITQVNKHQKIVSDDDETYTTPIAYDMSGVATPACAPASEVKLANKVYFPPYEQTIVVGNCPHHKFDSLKQPRVADTRVLTPDMPYLYSKMNNEMPEQSRSYRSSQQIPTAYYTEQFPFVPQRMHVGKAYPPNHEVNSYAFEPVNHPAGYAKNHQTTKDIVYTSEPKMSSNDIVGVPKDNRNLMETYQNDIYTTNANNGIYTSNFDSKTNKQPENDRSNSGFKIRETSETKMMSHKNPPAVIVQDYRSPDDIYGSNANSYVPSQGKNGRYHDSDDPSRAATVIAHTDPHSRHNVDRTDHFQRHERHPNYGVQPDYGNEINVHDIRSPHHHRHVQVPHYEHADSRFLDNIGLLHYLDSSKFGNAVYYVRLPTCRRNHHKKCKKGKKKYCNKRHSWEFSEDDLSVFSLYSSGDDKRHRKCKCGKHCKCKHGKRKAYNQKSLSDSDEEFFHGYNRGAHPRPFDPYNLIPYLRPGTGMAVHQHVPYNHQPCVRSGACMPFRRDYEQTNQVPQVPTYNRLYTPYVNMGQTRNKRQGEKVTARSKSQALKQDDKNSSRERIEKTEVASSDLKHTETDSSQPIVKISDDLNVKVDEGEVPASPDHDMKPNENLQDEVNLNVDANASQSFDDDGSEANEEQEQQQIEDVNIVNRHKTDNDDKINASEQNHRVIIIENGDNEQTQQDRAPAN